MAFAYENNIALIATVYTESNSLPFTCSPVQVEYRRFHTGENILIIPSEQYIHIFTFSLEYARGPLLLVAISNFHRFGIDRWLLYIFVYILL